MTPQLTKLNGQTFPLAALGAAVRIRCAMSASPPAEKLIDHRPIRRLKNRLQNRAFPLLSAFLYGEDLLD